MPREKEGFREVLDRLRNEENCPWTMTQSEAAEKLNMSRQYFANIVARGKIEKQDGKISLVSIAKYLCR